MLCGSRPSRLGRWRLSFEKRTEQEACLDDEGPTSYLCRGIIAFYSYRIKSILVWCCLALISFVIGWKKERRHRAPALMTCQFRRVRRGVEKKVTLEWPSIILSLCGEMELRLIVFGSALLITPHSVELLCVRLLFGRCLCIRNYLCTVIFCDKCFYCPGAGVWASALFFSHG